MKTLIIALTLLFSSAVIAHELPPENANPEQFTAFVEENVEIGLKSNDQLIYVLWMDKTFRYGTAVENMAGAIRFGHCAIMWREIHENMSDTDRFTKELVAAGIWRAEAVVGTYVSRAGGDISRVETYLLPALVKENDSAGDVTGPNIVSCTAMDLAVFNNLSAQGLATMPPEEWELQPIPEEILVPLPPQEDSKPKIQS